MPSRHKDRNFNVGGLKGTRLVVAAFGTLCGLTGVIAGIFEVLQGNISTDGFVISTIGPNYLMYQDFTYYAVTIIPNFLITGILAIITSSIVILWSVRYVQREKGALILFALSVVQVLVGGGWVIDLGFIASVLATRIDNPIDWWHRNLNDKIRYWLKWVFPFSVAAYSLISLCMLVLSITGVNSEASIRQLEFLAAAMFVPVLLMIIGGMAYDINK
jgi:hypothetical protein